MSIRRTFMDWNQPVLPNAVDYLTQKYFNKTNRRFEMDNVLVVVSGSRAGRRFSQLLAEKADQTEAILFPPRVQTVGHLPENLYQPKRPFASELVQHLAWVEAIKKQKRSAKKLFPHLPDTKQTVDWLDLAALLSKVHRELAADGLDFSDVVNNGRKLKNFSETNRWKMLRNIQQSYLTILDGLNLWDLQTARLVAISEKECETKDDIYLLATADLNRSTRQMLDQVSNQVVALIHAPENEALGFDAYGCLEPDFWKDKSVPLDEQHIIVADQPGDQADAVCHIISELDSNDPVAIDEIVVGVPSADLAPFIERKLAAYSLNSHWAVGRSLHETSPFKLLEAISAVIEKGRYPDFATLIRHPDIESWLAEKAKIHGKISADRVIGECDRYYAKHLVPNFEKWLGKGDQYRNLKWAINEISTALKPLRRKSLPFKEWLTPILELVTEIYSSHQFNLQNEADAGLVKSLSQIRSILESFFDIPEPLNISTAAVNVLRLLLQNLSSQAVTPKPKIDAIELLGWLELPLDIAPVVVVTNFNEGAIPESLNADMFLPDGLRKTLGLTDNQRRYARDAYALSTLVHSKSNLYMVVGKRELSGDPMTPSRLFFACDRESIAKRAMQFANPKSFAEVGNENAAAAIVDSQFVVPMPATDGLKIDSIRVTAFKTFLKCPYRFYLQHVLKLEEVHDTDRELNAMVFGNVLHEIFRRFGEHRLRFSENESEIDEFVKDQLDSIANQEFGQKRLPAIEIQLQQMRYRLEAFAKWQAQRTKDGWEVHFVEKKPPNPRGVEFEYDQGESVFIRGTIDRIDFHQQLDTWQILDYKTGDAGDSPQKTHQEKGKWSDLQLPLYKHIAKTFGVDGKVQLGYIVIPKDVSSVGEKIANWSDEELESAMQVARDCSLQIMSGEFWKPTLPAPPMIGSEFAPICQDDVFEPRLAKEVEAFEVNSVEGNSVKELGVSTGQQGMDE